jgi:uncharacterized membrane protein YgdD (TMEM256/DUF423 family)
MTRRLRGVASARLRRQSRAMQNQVIVVRVAAVLGFLGVALGAFGAHGLQDLLQKHDRLATWETAVFYHLIHAVVLLALGMTGRATRVAWIAFVAGILVFSCSLYILCLTNVTWLGAITPLGGLALLVGWAAVAVQAGRGSLRAPAMPA